MMYRRMNPKQLEDEILKLRAWKLQKEIDEKFNTKDGKIVVPTVVQPEQYSTHSR